MTFFNFPCLISKNLFKSFGESSSRKMINKTQYTKTQKAFVWLDCFVSWQIMSENNHDNSWDTTDQRQRCVTCRRVTRVSLSPTPVRPSDRQRKWSLVSALKLGQWRWTRTQTFNVMFSAQLVVTILMLDPPTHVDWSRGIILYVQ